MTARKPRRASRVIAASHAIPAPIVAPEPPRVAVAPLYPTGLTVGYVKSTGFSSRLIEWWGAGGWSHATTLVEPGWVIDARFSGGVARRPVAYLKDYEVEWLRVPCSADAVRETIAVLHSQIGKPYNWTAILAFASKNLASLVSRDWRSNRWWFCSEVQGWAGEGRAWPRLRTASVTLTPGDMRLVASARGAIKLPGPIFT